MVEKYVTGIKYCNDQQRTLIINKENIFKLFLKRITTTRKIECFYILLMKSGTNFSISIFQLNIRASSERVKNSAIIRV